MMGVFLTPMPRSNENKSCLCVDERAERVDLCNGNKGAGGGP